MVKIQRCLKMNKNLRRYQGFMRHLGYIRMARRFALKIFDNFRKDKEAVAKLTKKLFDELEKIDYIVCTLGGIHDPGSKCNMIDSKKLRETGKPIRVFDGICDDCEYSVKVFKDAKQEA